MKTQTELIHSSSLTRDLRLKERYEIIENEAIETNTFKELTISGSLFSLTTFRNVTFQSCVFFASKLENCEFIGCEFIDCTFQFTNVSYCNFSSTLFENCNWDYSPLKACKVNNSFLDTKTSYFLSKEPNELENCFSSLQGERRAA